MTILFISIANYHSSLISSTIIVINIILHKSFCQSAFQKFVVTNTDTTLILQNSNSNLQYIVVSHTNLKNGKIINECVYYINKGDYIHDYKNDQERNGHIEAIVKNIFADGLNNLHQYLHVMMYIKY